MKTAIILLLSAVMAVSAADDGWVQKKAGANYKAFVKSEDGSSYRIEAEFICSPDSVYKFLTSYEKFPEYYDNIKSIKILHSTDSLTLHYTVMSVPWPFSDRDMVTEVKTVKKDTKVILRSSSAKSELCPEYTDKVRVSEFEETLEIEKTFGGGTKLFIEGKISIQEKLPDWLKEKLILSGPVRTIEIINKKFGRRKN
jgi:hypothetical protein